MIDYFTLRTELINDPLHLGYSGYLATNDYISTANLLDKIGSGSAFTVWRNDIAPKEVVNNILPADFIKITAQQYYQLSTLFVAAPIDATLSGIRTNFGIVFSGASGTVANLTALAERQGSRAEVLFGDGTTLTDADVREALSMTSGISG